MNARSKYLFIKPGGVSEEDLEDLCKSCPGLQRIVRRSLYHFAEFDTAANAEAALRVLRNTRLPGGHLWADFDRNNGVAFFGSSSISVSPTPRNLNSPPRSRSPHSSPRSRSPTPRSPPTRVASGGQANKGAQDVKREEGECPPDATAEDTGRRRTKERRAPSRSRSRSGSRHKHAKRESDKGASVREDRGRHHHDRDHDRDRDHERHERSKSDHRPRHHSREPVGHAAAPVMQASQAMQGMPVGYGAAAAAAAAVPQGYRYMGGMPVAADMYGGPMGVTGQGMPQVPPSAPVTLHVSDLPRNATEREMSLLFRFLPGFLGLRMLSSLRFGEPRPYLFVDFVDKQAAANAMANLSGYRVDELSPPLCINFDMGKRAMHPW